MKELDEFSNLEIIGQGSFGKVFKAVNSQGRLVALKQIKFQGPNEGIPATALREISVLKSLKNHSNIVPVMDVKYKAKEKLLVIVFEYSQYDLKKYLALKEKLEEKIIKKILKQILTGVSYCHARKVLHRDIKPQNILIDHLDNVKIADFGLARMLMIPIKTLTREVETLWYRAPEILLGESKYTFSVDVWAIGCVFAELYLKRPIFYGKGYEIQQILMIFQIMGTPSLEEWANLSNLPHFIDQFPKWKKQPLKNLLPGISEQGLDLLEQMLRLNPEKRISALECLAHPFLKETILS